MNEPHIRVEGREEGRTPAALGEGDENVQSAEQRFLEHYGLSEQPFGVTPDPRFLYLGPKHRQALAALNYGTESNRGFLTLIAQPGMGKTSLLFNYLADPQEQRSGTGAGAEQCCVELALDR